MRALPDRFTHAAMEGLAVTGGARCLMDREKGAAILTCRMVFEILLRVEIAENRSMWIRGAESRHLSE